MTNDEINAISNIISPDDFKKMLDHLPRLVMLINRDGIIEYWNAGGAEVFGYSAEESIGQAVWFLYPRRSKELFLSELSTLEKGGLISDVFEGQHKDGRTVWVDVKRRFIGLQNGKKVILGSASDISPQIMAEEETKYNKKRLETILSTIVEGVITINDKGLIQGFNPAAEKIFGYDAEEVVGKNVNVIMPEPYHSKHNSYIQDYLRTGEKKVIGIGREVRGLRKDGSIFPMDLSISELRFDGEIIFTALIRDITRRRRMENEILRIGEEERKRIGQELHDGLGQMLTGIGLISKNLARKLEANALPAAGEAQEIYEMIREADEQAKTLSHGLVHIELEEGVFSDAIHHLCRRAKRLFDIECKVELDLNFDIENQMAKLHLYRIVQESISNAVKHGKATHIQVRLEAKDDYMRLIIEDNGMGFEASGKREQLKGIGLNTMNYRAHILGGNLNFDESEEGNTRIICTIPKLGFEKHIKK